MSDILADLTRQRDEAEKKANDYRRMFFVVLAILIVIVVADEYPQFGAWLRNRLSAHDGDAPGYFDP